MVYGGLIGNSADPRNYTGVTEKSVAPFFSPARIVATHRRQAMSPYLGEDTATLFYHAPSICYAKSTWFSEFSLLRMTRNCVF